MSYTEKDIREAAYRAIDQFDAKRVADVMEFVGWRWVNTDEETPQHYEINKQLRELVEKTIERAIHKPDGKFMYSTGGLEVEYEDGFWTIYFKLEDCQYDVDWLNGEIPW